MPMMFEVIFSLILLGLFAFGTFSYIASHTNGEEYFSKFYAADIASSADIVLAGAGDVVLRYDNLKPNLDITFWLSNGRVAAGKSTLSNAQPIEAAESFYGVAPAYYPSAGSVLVRPLFLLLRKSGGTFAITEDGALLKTCPVVAKRVVEPSTALVLIDIKKSITAKDAEAIKTSFAKTLPDIKTTRNSDDKPNIVLSVTLVQGTQDTLSFAPTGPDGAAYACLFAQTLEQSTLIPFVSTGPAQTSGAASALNVDIMISSRGDASLQPDAVGRALAATLAAYFSGATGTGAS
jgi:hypothetical protein